MYWIEFLREKSQGVEQSATEGIKESALDYPLEDRDAREENERIGSAPNGEACISFTWHGNEWLAGSTRGAAIYSWVTHCSVTNEPLQSPLRPTVDAAWLAEFIADANSQVSAIRGHRWELPWGSLSTCGTLSILSACRYHSICRRDITRSGIMRKVYPNKKTF